MSIDVVSNNYLTEKKLEDTIIWEFNDTAHTLEYEDNKYEHVKAFMEMRHPKTGELLKREQGGERPTNSVVKGWVTNFDASFTAWVFAKLNAAQQRFIAMIVAFAMDIGRTWEEDRCCYARVKGQLVPARNPALITV